MRTMKLMGVILMPFIAVCAMKADVVETKDGSRFVGKITQIDGSTIIVETKSAGAVHVKQEDVTTLAADHAAHVRLASGTVISGTVSSPSPGAITITGSDGTVHSTVDKIVAVWAPGGVDPDLAVLKRTWSYQASVDVVGKSGNSDQLGTGFSFRAILVGPQDKLQFYSAYDRQMSEGDISADQFKAGTDYQNSFSGRYSWYLRDEAGFDRVKLIDFSNIAAAGFGYDFVKKPKHVLTGRIGFAHRFESYKVDPVLFAEYRDPASATYIPDESLARRSATRESTNSAGLDAGVVHTWDFTNFSINNSLNFDPTFKDFSDYRITHESNIELPLQIPSWKLRFGVANDYTSKPAKGKRRMDTTYFTHLVLNWK